MPVLVLLGLCAQAAAASPALVPVPAPTKNCTRDTSYQLPGPLPLNTSQPGLTQAVDAPHYFDVYGNTMFEINSQIRRCRPVLATGYAGITKHSLTFRYSSAIRSDGMCGVTNVAVGVHVGMVLPRWTKGEGTERGLTATWRTYVTGLTAFLQVYVDNDLHSAQQLLLDVQQVPAQLDCNTLATQVATASDRDINALAQMNYNHSAQRYAEPALHLHG